jgi:hypothetical protein
MWQARCFLLSGVFSAVSFFTNGPETAPTLLISLVNSASPLLGTIGLGWLGLLLLQQPTAPSPRRAERSRCHHLNDETAVAVWASARATELVWPFRTAE